QPRWKWSVSHWIAPWQDIPANIRPLQRIRCNVAIGDVEVDLHGRSLCNSELLYNTESRESQSGELCRARQQPSRQPPNSPLEPRGPLSIQTRSSTCRTASAFLTAAVDRKTVSPDRLANPTSRYVVQAGGVIQPAKILSGLEQRGKISRGWTWQKFGSARNCFRFRGRALWWIANGPHRFVRPP